MPSSTNDKLTKLRSISPPAPVIRQRYLVASHSVRITKHGYAIDPIELRYAEITNKLTPAQRRQSDLTLDSSQLGHRVLTLIRGFWSQSAWPRGRQMSAKQQQQQEQQLQQLFRSSPNENQIDALITFFRSTSFYPHKHTLGQMSIAPVSPPPPHQFSSLKQSSILSSKKKTASRTRAQRSSRLSTDDNSLYYLSWIPKNKDLVAEMVGELCQKLEQIFANESRILNIKSPCTVLGDIHGNLLDLRTYERSLWPKAPSCLTSNYLFLGDYVDRGEHSVECVLYLFAMKLIAPNRFFLLRGNHEIASIQRQYTFGSECDTKFGVAGRQLWRSFNKVFNVMPIAAIIDDQIFCAHGGIPRSVTDISELARDIPSPLENPEIQSPAAWEILWNDPITDSEMVAMIEMETIPMPTNNASTGGTQSSQDQQTPGPDSQPTVSGTSTAIKSPTETFRQTPFESALSFYIRPADQPQRPQQPAPASPPPPSQPKQQASSSSKDQSSKANKSSSKRPPHSAPRPSPDQSSDDTLRTVPSDTSSIASTSPAQLLNDGFVANIKRGTAFLFSDRAIEHFLEVNKFSHVIRAHEVIPTGFAFHGDGRVITIFSSSQYCGLNNQAACALVDRNRIRILRLDTGDAGE